MFVPTSAERWLRCLHYAGGSPTQGRVFRQGGGWIDRYLSLNDYDTCSIITTITRTVGVAQYLYREMALYANDSHYRNVHVFGGILFAALEYDIISRVHDAIYIVTIDELLLFGLSIGSLIYLLIKKRRLPAAETPYNLGRSYAHICTDYLSSCATTSFLTVFTYFVANKLPILGENYGLTVYTFFLILNALGLLVATGIYSFIADEERKNQP
jgi:hypothetical protein